MKLGKEQYQTNLIQQYLIWNARDKHDVDPISCLARDEKRKIEKIFFKTFHEPISKYLPD